MNKHVSRFVVTIRRWLRAAATSDRALDAEIESVLQHEVDARIAAGMSPAEATRTARAMFGSVEPIKEQVRDARTGALVESLGRDVRYAWRGMGRSPGLSMAVVGSLAVGLAVTVAAMAFIKATLFGSYPGISEQERLVDVELRRAADGRPPGYPMQSETDYLALRAGLDGLQDLTAVAYASVTAVLPEPRSLPARLVSANYFDVLGTRPVLGRTFSPDEDRLEHAAVAVISHLVWRRDFSGETSVIGRTIRVADAPVTIVGVAPAGFGGTSGGRVDIWLPLAMGARVAPNAASMPGRERPLTFVGRLKDGVGPEQIQVAAATIATQRLLAEGTSGQQAWAEISSISRVDRTDRAEVMLVIMPIPLLVLTIACVNASTLLLARGARRRHELAVRLAIGAGRGRIVRQLVIESLMLGLLAAGTGVLLASWGLQIAEGEFSFPMPIDVAVLLWTLLVTVACAVVSGLMPALRATARAPFRALVAAHADMDGMRRAPRGRRLVVVQIALSIGVLATATQLVSLVAAMGGAGGTPPDRLLIASFDLGQLRFAPESADRFYAELVHRASALPGVEDAGLARSTAIWTFGRFNVNTMLAVWQPGATAKEGRVILGGYAGGDLFGALSLAVIEGRTFMPADRTGPPRVAVVNEAYANQIQGSALGRTLRIHGVIEPTSQTSDETFAAGRDVEIVGVIESTSDPRFGREGWASPKVYLPAPLEPEPALALYVRTRADADTMAAPVRDLVRAIDPRVPILEIGSLETWNERSMGRLPWLMRAGTFMGLMALLLAATGLLAVVSYVVSLRTREFALRMALGSHPCGVLVLVLRQAMRMVVVGFAIGGGLALLASRLLQTEFRNVQGLDIAAFVGSTALLMVVMLLASVTPAIRASRVDPVAALKEG